MIKDKKCFIDEGRFYKGNTHTHTKNSDGQATYDDRIRDYIANGYDFLVLADHEYYSIYTEYNSDTFLFVPGMEFECGSKPEESALGYHTTCFAYPNKNTIPEGRIVWPEGTTIDDQMKYVLGSNNYCIAAHPYWLGMRYDTLIDQFKRGCIGMEIFNSICHFGWGTGFSEGYLDYAIMKGYYPLIFAADDYHGPAFSDVKDHFTGYIKVKAKELTYDSIIDSILKGSFFASYAGPDIHNFEIKDGTVIVDCDPCFMVGLRSPQTPGEKVMSFKNDVTHAEFKLGGYEKCVRVVVDDGKGHMSWSQILTVENV